MKQGCKHIAGILILLLACCFLNAQVNVRATVNRDNILIGEPFSLTVEAYMPLGSSISWFNSDTMPHFEVTDRSVIDTAENIDGKKITQVLNLTSFDSGRWQIPPFEIVVAGQSFYTDSIPVNVTFTPFDPKEDYRDIKDIIEVKNPSVRYIPWIIAGLTVLSLSALAYFMRKKKPLVRDVKIAAEAALSPYEEAVTALNALGKKLPAEGEEKDFIRR